MNDQLAWLTAQFDEHDVEYWVESGTLLTLHRSGALTEYDDDIDVAVWASDLETVEALRPAIEARGYDVQVRTYRGHPYKYQFIPTDERVADGSSDERLIDLMVFRESGDHAWTAQSRLAPAVPVPGLSTALAWAAPAIERYARSATGDVEMASFPKRLLADVLTLWLPLEFVGSRRYDDVLGVYTPADVEPYLEFRYGDWRTPVEDWSLTDDRAVRLQDPGPLFDRLGRRTGALSDRGDPVSGGPEPVARRS